VKLGVLDLVVLAGYLAGIAGLGLWLARGLVAQDITQGLILLYLPASALALGLLVATGTGLLAGLLPAVGAMRLSVIDALRRV
jgi:ABC-type antimicrobial peptide transport system permease subunit